MKEEWLMPGAVVPVDPDTTKALVDEIKRLIGIVGGMALQATAPVQEPVAIVDEDGVIVVCNYKYKPGDKFYTTPPATQRQWVGLTVEEIHEALLSVDPETKRVPVGFARFAYAVEAKLRSKNDL
jgi:hypothetical protein